MRLPEYKYFDAAENQNKYLNFTVGTHADKIGGHECEHTLFIDKYSDQVVKIGHKCDKRSSIGKNVDFIRGKIVAGVHNSIQYDDVKELLLSSVDCSYYSKCDVWRGGGVPHEFTNLFHKSVKVYNVKHIATVPIQHYAANLLIGWFLLNWKKYIEHEIYLTIEITNEVKINLYKKEKKLLRLYSDCLVIMVPNITLITINGVEYQWF